MNKFSRLLFSLCLALACMQSGALLASAETTDSTHDIWTDKHTGQFIDMFQRVAPAISRALIQELTFSGEILEIGCGPRGGIANFLPRELLKHLTLSEPNAQAYAALQSKLASTPRLKHLATRSLQADAASLPTKLPSGKAFKTIVATNVMDCIADGGMEHSIAALTSLRALLQPEGRIVLIHYLNPSLSLISSLVNAECLTNNCVAFPYYSSTLVEDYILPDCTVAFADRDTLQHPHPSAPDKSLAGMIDFYFLGDLKSIFYGNPGAALQLACHNQDALSQISRSLHMMTPTPEEDRHYGIQRRTFFDLYEGFLADAAEQAGLEMQVSEHKMARAETEDATNMPGGVGAYLGISRWSDSDSLMLIYKTITLTPKP